MADYISQLLKDEVVFSNLQVLGYDEHRRGRSLLSTLDDFLKGYVTANEVNGTEPYDVGQDKEALADIVTEWLDVEGNGRRFWPGTGVHFCRLRYDAGEHDIIVRHLQYLVCAINQKRPGNIEAYLIELPRFVSYKRYTAIAQATLICKRKETTLHLKKGLSDADLCRTLKSELSCRGDSLDVISDELRARLRNDRVTRLPPLFSSLHQYHDRTEQAEVATTTLRYLWDKRIIAEIGDSEEEQLQNCAQVCARFCYDSGFELPRDLSDAALPDLAVKLAIMMDGRVDGQKHA